MINKKLIHFNTYSAFEANKSLLYDWTIAFIGETKQIYTHGNFYDCDIEDINELESKIAELQLEIGYSNGVYIVTDKGMLVTSSDWDNSYVATGVAIVQDGRYTIIGAEYKTNLAWGTESQGLLIDIPNVNNASDEIIESGVVNTDAITAIYSGTDCAAGYARSKQIKLGNKVLIGYLPSTQDIKYLLDYIELLSDISYSTIGIKLINIWFNTSVEYNATNYITSRYNGSLVYQGSATNKTSAQYYTFPFFQLNTSSLKSSIPTKVSQLENDKNYIENGDGYDSGVYIAVQSGKLIDPNEYDSTTETAVGVAVIDPKANFIIGLNHTASIPWGTSAQDLYGVDISGLTNYTILTTAETDMDGTANTDVITTIYSGTDCAAGLAKNSEQLLFGEDSLDPYLGSAGEWKIVINNYNAVKSAVATIGGNVLQSTSSLHYWTSTEYSSTSAWYAYFTSVYQYLGDYRKDASSSFYCVVPFYKIDNEMTVLSKINLITTPAGSSTDPIYIDSNGNIASTTYGGGTKVTLNGSSKGGSTASFYAPTSAGTSGYVLKSNGSGAPSWIAKTKTFTNVSASSWVDDTTYEDYPYKCDVSCSGVTSSYYAEVVFDTAEALSGNYAPVCSTGSSIVTIYSKVNDTITIPTIFATLS